MAKKQTIQDPIRLGQAKREFGLSRPWFMKRMREGKIRHVRVGRHLILAREDIVKLAPDEHGIDLLKRAMNREG
jgi:hypothetical protein